MLSRPEASPVKIDDSLWRSVVEPSGLEFSLRAIVLSADGELDD